MQFITEAQVAAALDVDAACQSLHQAFLQLSRGRAQVLARHRAAAPMAGAAMALR